MNKAEAAKYLGVSERAIERYTKAGKLKAEYIRGKTGDVLNLAEDELARSKEELNAPKAKATTVPDTSGNGRQLATQGTARQGATTTLARVVGAPTGANNADLLGFMAAFIEAVQSTDRARQGAPVEAKLVLTLDECRALTGFSQSTLKAAISDGTLKAQKIGRGLKVKRADLERYVEGL